MRTDIVWTRLMVLFSFNEATPKIINWKLENSQVIFVSANVTQSNQSTNSFIFEQELLWKWNVTWTKPAFWSNRVSRIAQACGWPQLQLFGRWLFCLHICVDLRNVFYICFRFIVPAISDVDEPYMTRYGISAFVKYFYFLIFDIFVLFKSTMLSVLWLASQQKFDLSANGQTAQK